MDLPSRRWDGFTFPEVGWIYLPGGGMDLPSRRWDGFTFPEVGWVYLPGAWTNRVSRNVDESCVLWTGGADRRIRTSTRRSPVVTVERPPGRQARRPDSASERLSRDRTAHGGTSSRSTSDGSRPVRVPSAKFRVRYHT